MVEASFKGLYRLAHVFLVTAWRDNHCYYPHFFHQKTEVGQCWGKGKDFVQDHTASRGWSQVSTLGSLAWPLVTVLFASLASQGEVCGECAGVRFRISGFSFGPPL